MFFISRSEKQNLSGVCQTDIIDSRLRKQRENFCTAAQKETKGQDGNGYFTGDVCGGTDW